MIAVIRSNVLPDIPIDTKETGGLLEPLLSVVKPEIVIDVPGLGKKTFAPYGSPGDGGPVVATIVLLVFLVGLHALIKEIIK